MSQIIKNNVLEWKGGSKEYTQSSTVGLFKFVKSQDTGISKYKNRVSSSLVSTKFNFNNLRSDKIKDAVNTIKTTLVFFISLLRQNMAKWTQISNHAILILCENCLVNDFIMFNRTFS